jgi:glycine hydroxymethyltransferase
MGLSKIRTYLTDHEKMRGEGINLVVSENMLSQDARNALASDLAGRYCASWYGGSSMARKIVEETEALAAELFDAKYALVLPLSGNICDVAALFAFTQPGDRVAILPFESGEDISRFIHEEIPDGGCAYDGSHVLGLLATKSFQDPLVEGADVLIGSTHKTFPGPQGGLIVTNSEPHFEALRRMLDFDLEEGLGLVDNPHVNRIAALGITIEELLEDQGYGKRVIENAQALARALDEAGVPVRFKDRGFTESHQVLLDLQMERATELCHALEEVSIFIDIGGRIGTAEVTRRGMGSAEMVEVANLIAEVYLQGVQKGLKEKVHKIARGG